MVNLLIAIMAKRLEEISGWKHELKKLEDLAIILYFEQRMNFKLAHLFIGFWVKILCRCCELSSSERAERERFKTDTKSKVVYVQTVQRISK